MSEGDFVPSLEAEQRALERARSRRARRRIITMIVIAAAAIALAPVVALYLGVLVGMFITGLESIT